MPLSTYNNPVFNYTEFGVIGGDNNPDKSSNIRDYSTLEQLVVLSNMESIKALLIQQGLSQTERLLHLNKVAITLMRSLVESKSM